MKGRLHPQERIERFTAAGWWTDDTWDSLLADQVGQRPDATAVVDAPNRATFMDGEPAALDLGGARTARRRRSPGRSTPKGSRPATSWPSNSRTRPSSWRRCSPSPASARSRRRCRCSSASSSSSSSPAWPARSPTSPPRGCSIDRQPRSPPSSSPRSARCARFWPSGPNRLRASWPVGGGQADRAATFKSRELDPADAVTLCWTSGTESTPKGVPRTHHDWIAIARATVDGVALGPGDVLLNPFPMVNMAGIGGMLLPWLMTGGTLVQHHPFDLPTFLRQVAEERVTYTVAPPALLTMLLGMDELLASADLSSLRIIGSGSAPLSPAMVKGWKRPLRHRRHELLRLQRGRGAARRPEVDPRSRAAGPVLSPNVARSPAWRPGWSISTAARRSPTPACPASCCVAGPTVVAGYLGGVGEDAFRRRRDGSAPATCSSWWPTSRERLRCYRFVDRAKDLVIRGGMNI